MPSDLEAAITAFVSYYNYRRYHMALDNVTPSDVLKGRRQQILERKKKVQLRTIDRRRRYNRTLNPNPPKDTDGRREGSGRGWVRELQGRWPGVLG